MPSIEGDVKLGDRVRIGPNCIIRNAQIGDDVEDPRELRDRSASTVGRFTASSGRSLACVRERPGPMPLTSAISSRSRTPDWAMAARRTTSRTWATPWWAVR